MKRWFIKKKMGILAGVIFVLSGTVAASANTVSHSMGGVKFTTYSTCTATRVTAGTTSSNSSFLGRVSSTYYYYYSSSGVLNAERKTATGYGSNAAFSVNATGSKKFKYIQSTHTGTYNSESFSCETSAKQ